MSYAINLYFDQETEKAIIDIWESLSRLNIGKCMTCANGRPHITLAIYEELNVERAKEALASLAQSFKPFQLEFLQIGIFPLNKGAIFLAPNYSQELLALHSQVHESFGEWAEKGWAYYEPQAWCPHCTLSLETPVEDIPKVLAEILKDFQALAATVRSIGLVSLLPIEYLGEYPF